MQHIDAYKGHDISNSVGWLSCGRSNENGRSYRSQCLPDHIAHVRRDLRHSDHRICTGRCIFYLKRLPADPDRTVAVC